MPPSAASRPAPLEKSGMLRVALGHGTRAFLFSLAVIVLGGGPSSPLAPLLSSVSSSEVASTRFGFVAAAATTADTAIAAAEHATAMKQAQAEKEEEDGLYSWYGERSSSAGRPLGLERNLAPAIEEEGVLEADNPSNFGSQDSSGSDLNVLLEGCTLPAEMTSVKAKGNKPTTGNIADNAIDGNPMTW